MKKIFSTCVLAVGLTVAGCGDQGEEELTAESNDTLAQSEERATVTTSVSCASTFFQRRECRVDTHNGRIVGARIIQEMSNPPFLCRQSDSHGFGRDHVWVDRGCSAEFEVTIELPSMERERVRCASFGQYNVCRSELRDIRDMRLLFEDPPFGRCQEGRNFGHYDDAIWVDEGCRGLFEVVGYRFTPPSARAQIDLFDRRDFTGVRYRTDRAVADLGQVDFNDRTRSLVVRSGQWEACTNAGFSGWCRTFGVGRYDDLGPLRDQISSIRPR